MGTTSNSNYSLQVPSVVYGQSNGELSESDGSRYISNGRVVYGQSTGELSESDGSRYISNGRVRRLGSDYGLSQTNEDSVSYKNDSTESVHLERFASNAEELDGSPYLTAVDVGPRTEPDQVPVYITPVVAQGSKNMDPDGYYILVPNEAPEVDARIHANMLKMDQYGYVVFPTHLNLPTAPPRPVDSVKQPRPVEPVKQQLSKTGAGCKRFRLAAFLLMALISTGSVTVSILVLTGTWKMYSSEASVTLTSSPAPVVIPLFCGAITRLNISEPGNISCTIMEVSSTAVGSFPSVSVIFTGDHLQHDVTYISSKILRENGTLENTISGYFGSVHHVTLTRGNDGRVDFKMTMTRVVCCDSGVVSVTIGHVTTSIRLDVVDTVGMPCEGKQLLKWNSTSAISCSQCICTRTPVQTEWMYKPVVGGVYEDVNTSTWTRYAPMVDEDEVRGVTKMELIVSPAYCHDGGTYKLFTSVGGVAELRETMDVSVTDYSVASPPAQISAKLLNPRHVSSSSCLFHRLISTPNVVAVSVKTHFANETIFTNSTIITASFRNNITLELSIVSGLLSALWQFEPIRCDHGGLYSIQAEGDNSANFSLTVDERNIVEDLTMSEMHDRTGYVEQYNITMKCQGKVGCKQHPVTLISPEVESNVTYAMVDVDGDGVADVYQVLIHWTIINISMALDGTQSTCKLSLENEEKITTKNIYVLESTFCDGRTRPCEYAYPNNCNMWVSCQRDRPLVKYCTVGQYYIPNGRDDCLGVCDYTCPSAGG